MIWKDLCNSERHRLQLLVQFMNSYGEKNDLPRLLQGPRNNYLPFNTRLYRITSSKILMNVNNSYCRLWIFMFWNHIFWKVHVYCPITFTDTDESEQNEPNEQDMQPAEGSADVAFVFQVRTSQTLTFFITCSSTPWVYLIPGWIFSLWIVPIINADP